MTTNMESPIGENKAIILSDENLSHILNQAKKREQSALYFIYDYIVQTKPTANQQNSHDIYLVGHHLLNEKVKIFAGFEDTQILSKLNSCKELKSLIYGMGIYVYSKHTSQLNVLFETKRSDHTNKVTTVSCKTDGTESFISIDDFSWSEQDEALQKLSFTSDQPNAIASVTIVFYLNEGFSAPDLTVDSPVVLDSINYKQMIEKSLIGTGSNGRLKHAIEKAKRGEEVTIAYIGGSVTQGAVAIPTSNSYAYQSYLQFKSLFGQDGGDHIHFIKAGVGGTPSELGMIRYERDILKNGKAHPDIIIVEFAVNDADDETNGISYESLVVRALQEPNNPAVILLFSVFFNDWNLQDRLAPIGKHYELPMVSIKDAVVDQFYLTKDEGQVITKRQFFYDIYHPSNAGHKIMADSLAYLFTRADAEEMSTQELCFVKSEPYYGNDFAKIQLIDRINIPSNIQVTRGGFNDIDNELQCVELDNNTHATPQFPYNWHQPANASEDSFKMTLTCKKLLIVFKDSGDSQFGKVDVLINNELVKQFDAHEVKWNHCHTVLLVNEEVSKPYQVEVKMAEGHENKCFTILGFGYVE